MWPNRRYLDLVGIDHPIIQAPMAGANLSAMAIVVSRAGGLGSLPCGMLDVAQVRAELDAIRQLTDKAINVNFFCHEQPAPDPVSEKRWRDRLAHYYAALGIETAASVPEQTGDRTPFDENMCCLMVEMQPRVVSFHYGLPERSLIEPLKAAGCLIQSTATTVQEARWLERHGADAIVAQGWEAGGHRGMFLARDIASQIGTFALVPQIVDAVRLPVIAAGGIIDARGIVAALALGASAVQIGTGYLLCPEARISAPYRSALRSARDDSTVLTNVLSGRPARGIVNRLIREVGPISADAPPFPLASGALKQLRATAEEQGSGDFSPLWAGQAAPLARELGAGDLTAALAAEAQSLIGQLAS
jgi:nitronate monooxygenase